MKKLINFTGGRGYYVDDVRVLQEQLESLKLVFGAFGNRAFIVQGCQVSAGAQAGQINVSPGLVYINGALVEVIGTNNFQADFNGRAYVSAVLNSGFAGQAFETRYYDLEDTFKTAFEYRFGVISASSPAPGVPAVVFSVNPFDRVTWIDYLKLLLTNQETKLQFDDWLNSGQNSILIRKDFQGFVRMKGQFLRTSNGSEYISFTLPVGFRPASDEDFYINGGSGGSNGNRNAARYGVLVRNTGAVSVRIIDSPEVAITGTFWCPVDDVYFRAV